MHRRNSRTLLFCTWMLACLPAFADFTASVSSNAISEADTLDLTLRWDGTSSAGTPDLSSLSSDFRVVGGPSTSTSLQMINGRQTEASISWVVTLEPKHTGTLRIPSIRYQGQATRPIDVEVTQLSNAARSRMQSLAFLLTSVDASEVYVQQQVLLTQKFYTRSSYRGDLPEAPALDHVLVKPLGEPKDYNTLYNGVQYLVREWRYALFPQESGEIEIPARTLSGNVQVRAPSFFDSGQWQRVQIPAEGHRIVVKPVPAGFHGGTWLPARSLTLQDSWEAAKPEFRVGDPVNRILTIAVDGLPQSAIPSLQQPSPANARIYSDPPTGDETPADKGLSSRQSVTLGIVPTREGTLAFPEIVINWWNTQTDRPESVRIPAASFPVSPGANPARPSVQTNFSAASAEGPPANTVAPAIGGYWIYLTGFFALAWLATMLFWSINRRSLKTELNARIAAAAAPTPEEITEAQRFDELTRACRANNAPDAREALLQWARALHPGQPLRTLDAFLQSARDDALADLVRRLDQILFASETSRSDWVGAELLARATSLRAAWQKRPDARPARVPALNPA